MKDLKNKNLVLAAIAREMNFWYDVSEDEMDGK